MAYCIETPSVVEAAGTKPKRIEELLGRVNTKQPDISIARMQSPAGWKEPGQTPKFNEYSVVLTGTLRAEHAGGVIDARAGQVIVAPAGEWVRYSTPAASGAEYIAICIPAFSPDTVNRDPS
jgi:ethanolamine utilization protein EutQ (cupin superfamily)